MTVYGKATLSITLNMVGTDELADVPDLARSLLGRTRFVLPAGARTCRAFHRIDCGRQHGRVAETTKPGRPHRAAKGGRSPFGSQSAQGAGIAYPLAER